MIGRRVRFAAPIAALMLLASACGGDAAEAPVDEKPVAGGMLMQGVIRPASLDPWRAQSVSERVLTDHLYDGLSSWHPNSLEAIPALAERWESADGNKSWTFHLRADAKAGNGEPVTATDVKSSLQRLARSGPSALAEQLAPLRGLGSYINDPAVPEIVGAVVVDERTVRLDLDSPMHDLPLVLGNPSFGVVHTSADGSTKGTGPFVIESTSPNGVVLTKAPESKALLDKINVTYFSDVAAAYGAFEQGTLDWSPVPPEKAAEGGSRYGSHLFEPSLRTLYLSFNMANPKFADPRFREAIVRAIDRPQVAQQLVGGDARVVNGIVPDGVPESQGGGCREKCAHDVQRAKDLLTEIFGEAPRPAVSIDVAANAPFSDASNKRIVDDLAAVGIQANLRAVPLDQFPGITVAPEREIFQTSWSASYPSADSFLSPLFLIGSNSNVSLFNAPAIDQKLRAAQTLTDKAEATRAFQAVENDVMEQLPVIPIASFPINAVAKRTVRGIATLPTGNFDATTVWLAQP